MILFRQTSVDLVRLIVVIIRDYLQCLFKARVTLYLLALLYSEDNELEVI